jgi:nitrite reductase/ring-hydroxylating ferredoxin subunit
MADFLKVASLRELPVGELLSVELEGHKLVLANLDGTVYALDGICTHQEAVLAEGSLYEECLMCPVHGGEYDVRTGEAITLPAIEPLRRHEVRVEDGEILVARPG